MQQLPIGSPTSRQSRYPSNSCISCVLVCALRCLGRKSFADKRGGAVAGAATAKNPDRCRRKALRSAGAPAADQAEPGKSRA
jgi:hypothetical protein